MGYPLRRRSRSFGCRQLDPTRMVMKAKQAVAWIKKCGIAVESARASVPSLAHVVAGEPTRGSWWAHPEGHDIFLLSRVIRRSPHVLVCRLVDGKITYVHRRMWPALVSLAGRFSRQRLAALKEVHTPSGKHKLLVTPFPDWVPDEVLRAARRLTEKEAASQLALVLAPVNLPKLDLLLRDKGVHAQRSRIEFATRLAFGEPPDASTN